MLAGELFSGLVLVLEDLQTFINLPWNQLCLKLGQ